METKDNINEKEEKEVFVLELLSEIKEQSRRWFRAFLVMVAVEVLTISGFIWYMNQYDFESSIEQNGVYTLIDSQGNVISSDITSEKIEQIMEIIKDGKNQNDKEKN